MKKLYVVNKYILANSAKDAIKQEKSLPVDEIYIDTTWKNVNTVIEDNPKSRIGFHKTK